MSRQCGTKSVDGVTFYYSYSQCVGFRRDGQPAHFTGERFSVTTARHIRQFMAELEYNANTVPADQFRTMLAAFPHVPNASFSRFPRESDDLFVRTGYAHPDSIIGSRTPYR
jgi:hypothetical protein